jgi:hypothetical protein
LKRFGWLAVVVLVLLLSIPLGFLLRDFVREAVAPEILRLYWSARLLLEGLPQLPIWIAFLLFALLGAISSLFYTESPSQAEGRPRLRRSGRVAILSGWIRRASQAEYFRWRLAQHLAVTTWEVMAYREHLDVQEVKERLRTGSLDVPPAALDYLRERRPPGVPASKGWLSRLACRLRRGGGVPSSDPGLESVVAFLEEQMEVEDARPTH